MNIIDIILLVFLLFGFVRGFIKGFFVELASLVALVAGIYGAIHFSYLFEELLVGWVSWEEKYIELTAFALTFIIIVLAISLLGKLLTKISNIMALGLVNKLLGALFGLLKTGLLLSVVLLFFAILNDDGRFVEEEKLENSILYQPVKNLVPMILPSVLEEARNLGVMEEQ
jgi:membrane protein required for colicin V production